MANAVSEKVGISAAISFERSASPRSMGADRNRSGLSSAEMAIQAKLPANCPARNTMPAPPKVDAVPAWAFLNITKDEIGRRVDEALDRYDLRPLRDHPAHLLSGGQKQLLAIAGVLAMAPEAIVFDEPTTLLDLRNKRRIAQAIDALPQRAIVVSHDLAFLEHFDRVLVFEDGRVAIDDRPAVALPAYVAMMS